MFQNDEEYASGKDARRWWEIRVWMKSPVEGCSKMMENTRFGWKVQGKDAPKCWKIRVCMKSVEEGCSKMMKARVLDEKCREGCSKMMKNGRAGWKVSGKDARIWRKTRVFDEKCRGRMLKNDKKYVFGWKVSGKDAPSVGEGCSKMMTHTRFDEKCRDGYIRDAPPIPYVSMTPNGARRAGTTVPSATACVTLPSANPYLENQIDGTPDTRLKIVFFNATLNRKKDGDIWSCRNGGSRGTYDFILSRAYRSKTLGYNTRTKRIPC